MNNQVSIFRHNDKVLERLSILQGLKIMHEETKDKIATVATDLGSFRSSYDVSQKQLAKDIESVRISYTTLPKAEPLSPLKAQNSATHALLKEIFTKLAQFHYCSI